MLSEALKNAIDTQHKDEFSYSEAKRSKEDKASLKGNIKKAFFI